MQAQAQAQVSVAPQLVEPALVVVPEEVLFPHVGVRSGDHYSIPRREQHGA